MLHFGADLGPDLPDLSLLGDAVPHSALDVPVTLGLIPQASSGWRGRPGLRGHRNGQAFSARLRVVSVERSSAELSSGERSRGADCSAVITQADPEAGVSVRTEIRINDGGLLQLRHRLDNDGAGPYSLDELATVLPVAPRRHRNPGPDRPLVPGAPPAAPPHPAGHLGPHRPARPDRPRLLAAARRRHRRLRQPPRAGLGHAPGLERQPREFADTVGGRPDHDRRARNCSAPAEIILAAGRQLHHPVALRRLLRPRAWTASARRSTAGSAAARTTCPGVPAPAKPRPVVLNIWEAVYFDHDLTTLIELAEAAAGARRGTLRARRRLVPRPPRRSRRPGRLVRRRGPLARRASRR